MSSRGVGFSSCSYPPSQTRLTRDSFPGIISRSFAATATGGGFDRSWYPLLSVYDACLSVLLF